MIIRIKENTCRKHPSIYESIQDLKIEQHANLIFAEKAEAETMKITKLILYEEIDEQLQHLIANFRIYPRKKISRKPELCLIFIFLIKFLNIAIFHVHNI
jgi:hypothetical protein